MEDWKRKYLEMFDNHRQMKEKLDELQSYLSDLPTVEESMKNIQEISLMRFTCTACYLVCSGNSDQTVLNCGRSRSYECLMSLVLSV